MWWVDVYNVREHRIDSSEKLATLGTHDTGRRQKNPHTSMQTTGGKDEPNIVCMRKL